MNQSFTSLGIYSGLGFGLFLALLGTCAWQINLVNQRRQVRRQHHQGLFEDLQQANVRSEQLNSELALEVEQRRLASTVFEAASEGIVILDPTYKMLAVNQAFSRISGYAVQNLVGCRVDELACSRDACRHFPIIRTSLDLQDSWQGELVEARENGELYPQWLQLKVVRDAGAQVSHIVAFISDLSARRRSEARVRHLTHFDELTGLANRLLFKERLEEANQRIRQGTSRNLALLHIDLDRFKLLNDSLGHELADQVLEKIAERLTKALPEADTIARLSGDEFAVLFDAYGSLTSLARVATRLLSKLGRPLVVDGHELVVSASIGISLLPDSARDITLLVSQASKAMHQAKHVGGSTFQFFSHSLQHGNLERLQLENQLRKAIADRQLSVFYQPKLCLKTGQMQAVEALVRWDHPQLGSVSPSDFIALAEETGLIGAIGEFVLREACRQASEWRRAGLVPIRVSVNLSGHQLRQGNLVSLVRQVLEDTGCPRPRLLGRGEIVHINCLVTQSTIKMRKRVQNIYVLSGHFLSLPHLLKCPQRKYMSHAIIKSLCQRNRQ